MTSRPASVVDIDGWNDLVELDEHGEGLTTWEADFVESLMQQLRAGKTLTEKQRARLDQITEERL